MMGLLYSCPAAGGGLLPHQGSSQAEPGGPANLQLGVLAGEDALVRVPGYGLPSPQVRMISE
jgi:hypothetical protein